MMNWKSAERHRTWEDWLGIGLGLVITLAPWITDSIADRAVIVNATLAGLAIVVLSELDLVNFRRWTQLGQSLIGLWVVLSCFVIGTSGSGALGVWLSVAGILVALLGGFEIWQGDERD